MEKIREKILNEEIFKFDFIIFGASEGGINTYNELKNMNNDISVRFFCDNDPLKEEKEICGIKIININSLNKIEAQNYLIVISSMYYEEIQNQLSNLDNRYKFIIDKELISYIKGEIIEKQKEKYCIDYNQLCKNWIMNIGEEVKYWESRFIQINKSEDLRLKKKEFSLDRIEKCKYSENMVVIDLGSGPIPKFGNRYNNKEITYIPVDPLAYFYNNLYKKYDIKPIVATEFGIMENLSLFFEKEYADFIIIDNALDHSINPVKSLIEAMKVIKIGGYISLGHYENEAIFAGHDGLHQWNIFVNSCDEFIIYNKTNTINITKLLNSYAKIEVNKQNCKAYGMDRYWISINIIKLSNLNNNFIEKYDNEFDTSMLIKNLFYKISQTIE